MSPTQSLLQLLRREPARGRDREHLRLSFERPAFARALDRGARPQRIGDADRAFQLELARRGRHGVRTQAGQQLVQNDAERVDVARGRDRPAENLFGARVLRREQPVVHARERHRRSCFAGVEQLGDAEVEQLRRAFRGHQDVRGLQVAVHDQVLVCVLDGAADVEEQLQSLAHVRAAGDRNSDRAARRARTPSRGRDCRPRFRRRRAGARCSRDSGWRGSGARRGSAGRARPASCRCRRS